MTLFTQLRDSFLAMFARKSTEWHIGNQAYRDGKGEDENPYAALTQFSTGYMQRRETEWLNGFYGR